MVDAILGPRYSRVKWFVGHVEAESAQETLGFLKDWWLNHINLEDRKYAPIVRRHLGG